MREKLKPCPFCGSVKLTSEQHYVSCKDCGTLGPDINDLPKGPNTPFEAWNMRVKEK
jgi:RNA polymerase subunit RPABC4/transcription elongation factor Spt4